MVVTVGFTNGLEEVEVKLPGEDCEGVMWELFRGKHIKQKALNYFEAFLI